jgi:hypothetical protein
MHKMAVITVQDVMGIELVIWSIAWTAEYVFRE